jgi:hypothetical protein
MVVTPADLASALFVLVLLEGFRRVKHEEFVLTRWKRRWRAAGSPLAIWFRTIEWLWVLPLQTEPGTFICRRENTAWERDSVTSVDAIQREVRESGRYWRRLCVLTTVQACLLLFLIPALAIAGSTIAIYSGISVVLILGLFITAGSWSIFRWRSLKYLFYPPASVFAVLEATIDCLEGFDFDAIVMAFLPEEEALPLLRQHYRAIWYGSGRTKAESDRVQSRMKAMMQVRKLDVAAITRPPKRSSEGIVTYCPSCDAEFVIHSGECSDCPGVTLVRFAEAG